jgi:hypothetical protein
MLASLFGRTAMVQLLSARGANAKTRNRWGFTARTLGFFSRIFSRLRRRGYATG